MISTYRADQLKRFVPFSYLNHSVIELRFILGLLHFFRFHFVFFSLLTVMLVCWLRGLCISFTSCLLPVKGGRVKSLRSGGVKKLYE